MMEMHLYVVIWITVDTILVLATISGNLLTLFAIILCRKLSAVVSNCFVFGLAMSDLLVGCMVPYHLLFSIGYKLSSNKPTCILRFVLVILACASSIYSLFAIATDRYLAIVHPLHYNKFMNRKVVTSIIIFGWILTLSCASIILYWNNWDNEYECTLNHVAPREYLTYVLTPMFASVWLAILVVYLKIWRVASKHAKRIKKENPNSENYINDSKSVQVVMLILGCFSICWLPYFICITCLKILGEIPDLIYEITFTLAMANSCMNPLIYAWKNSNFREAFWYMMHCKSPNQSGPAQNYITNHTPIHTVKRGTLTSNGKSETTSNHTEIELYDTKSQGDDKDWDQESADNTTISTGVFSLQR